MPVAGETTHVRHGPAGDVSRRLVVSMVRLEVSPARPSHRPSVWGGEKPKRSERPARFQQAGVGSKTRSAGEQFDPAGHESAPLEAPRQQRATSQDAGCRMQEAGTQDAAQVATQAGPQRAAKKLHHFEGRPPTGVVLRCFPPHATLGESKTNQRRTTCRSSFEAETSK